MRLWISVETTSEIGSGFLISAIVANLTDSWHIVTISRVSHCCLVSYRHHFVIGYIGCPQTISHWKSSFHQVEGLFVIINGTVYWICISPNLLSPAGKCRWPLVSNGKSRVCKRTFLFQPFLGHSLTLKEELLLLLARFTFLLIDD